MMNKKPYRIIGVYDSETTNIYDGIVGSRAFPILHQLGLIDCDITSIDSRNVEHECRIELYRHTIELTTRLDEIATTVYDYVPVICCHNLGFDMHPLAAWLTSRKCRVLAKSPQKPISFTVLDEDRNPRLVIWDTLLFSGQSLAKMGHDCGYDKAVGSWDYDLIRTPQTPLTDDELYYAKTDIYTLFVWLSWWLKRNPDIEPQTLGLNVVTKTGVVRQRRKLRFDQLRGQGMRENVGRMWLYQNRENMPKDDDELFTMRAATRGGFTFCAHNHASQVYDLPDDECIIGYDAVSMHPSHMVAHRYPNRFELAKPQLLDIALKIAQETSIKNLLKNFATPFPVAFYMAIEVKNLRLKANSIYERDGIGTLASARFRTVDYEPDEDNGQRDELRKYMEQLGYKDTAHNPRYAFGKLVAADSIIIFVTELEAWILNRVYDFDSIEALCGYLSTKYVRPTDMSVLSVMQFYDAKNVFKAAKAEYLKTNTITCVDELKRVQIPETVIADMVNGMLSRDDLDNLYLRLKADLNALFGIEASNEYRQDTVISDIGIAYQGDFSIQCAPKNPKAWYQFGQRIVGWSRVAQIIAIELVQEHIISVVNGDTDSIKLHCKVDKIPAINAALNEYAVAVDVAKEIVCKRVKAAYPQVFSRLDGIGHYESEFMVRQYCAGWNKAYCVRDNDSIEFTLAGIPSRRGLNDFADDLYAQTGSFDDVASLLLGYNVVIDYTLTGLNARHIPEWQSVFSDFVTDYQGNSCFVVEPEAIAIYRMQKSINSTDNVENLENSKYAILNNAKVNLDHILIYKDSNGFNQYRLPSAFL